jgi:hypothetical protein
MIRNSNQAIVNSSLDAFSVYKYRHHDWRAKAVFAVLFAFVMSSAYAVGHVSADRPWILVSVLCMGISIPVAAVLIFSPNVCTLAFIFILYTNIAGIAVNVHGLPSVLGNSFILLLLPPVVYHFVIRRQRVIITPVLPFIAAFILVQAIGTAMSKNPGFSAKILFSSIVEGFVLYVLVTNVIRNRSLLRSSIWVLAAAGSFLGAITLLQFATGSFDSNMGGFMQNPGKADAFLDGTRQQRAGGPIDSANVFAQIMLMLVPLAMSRCSEPVRWLRMAAFVASGLIALACVLSFSRGAAVAVAIMLMVGGLKGYIRLRYLCLFLILAIASLMVLPEYRDRIASIATAKALVVDDGVSKPDSSIRGRTTEMISAMIVFSRNPIIGVGPGMNKFYSAELSKNIGIRLLDKNRKSHSLYPDIAADYGILGLGCFLTILYITLRDLSRTRKRCFESDPETARIASSFYLAIIAYMGTGIFIHFSFIRFFWLIIALANVFTTLNQPRPLRTYSQHANAIR